MSAADTVLPPTMLEPTHVTTCPQCGGRVQSGALHQCLDPTGCQCYAVITNPERARVLAGIFPGDRIPLRHPMVAGQGEWTRKNQKETGGFYEAAIERFTPEQKVRVAEAVLKLGFRDVTKEEVLRDMANPKMVIPLKAEGAIISFCEMHSRLMMTAAMDLEEPGFVCPECGDPSCHSCNECGQMECECTCQEEEFW